MALPTSYMTGNYSKISNYFESIINAQAPEKFTIKFLKDLGFTSSTDLQFINVLKSLGFLDNSGTPTQKYYALFDGTRSRKLVAEGLKESYEDLFALNKNAQKMSREELRGKFKTLTAGQKSDHTIDQMVSTFLNLCEYADWSGAKQNVKMPDESITNKPANSEKNEKALIDSTDNNDNINKLKMFDLNYVTWQSKYNRSLHST